MGTEYHIRPGLSICTVPKNPVQFLAHSPIFSQGAKKPAPEGTGFLCYGMSCDYTIAAVMMAIL